MTAPPTEVSIADADARTVDIGGSQTAPPSSEHLSPGDRVGRYVLIEELGAGGMGVVYLGYDTELHRKAGLKVLRGRRTGRDSTEGRQRLVREARAMAQLSHPNVVTVYDVGTVDDGLRSEVYVAMEFVQGNTLREWARARRRSWIEIVTVFVRAGRGLAAAHAVGLVHRDFKPDNVLIGADERPRVLDFGLAWAPEIEEDDLDPSASRTEARRVALTSDLTEAGAVVGTPTYMAPEQHLGLRPDHRSDQFSFCVALYETLYRQRPYEARDLDELARAKRRAKVREPPDGALGPKKLFRVLRRGLEPDPSHRWPDMDTLIAALRRVRTRGRRWTLGGVGLAVGGVALTWSGLRPREPARGACHAASDKLRGVWDADRKRGVRAAMEGTALPYAADAARRVETALDAYTRSWVDMARRNCEATLAGEQSAELLDRRTACLRRRLAAVQSLVEVLADADLEVVRRAVQAVEELPSLERCADTEALLQSLPEPDDPQLARAVTDLREALERARTLESSGRMEPARAILERAVERARGIDYGPVLGEALWSLGRLLHAVGDAAAAQGVLEEAYAVSLTAGHDAQAARAAVDLVFLLGYTLARFEQADAWILHARAEVRRVDPGGELQALLHNVLGATEAARRDFADAKDHFERALAIEQSQLGRRHLSVARTLHNLGSMESELGDYEAARPHLERALALRTEAVGPHHPLVGSIHQVLGGSYFFEGDFDRAREHYDAALRIAEHALGRNHPTLAEHAVTAGFAYLGFGERDRARELGQRAITILDAEGVRATPELGRALHLLGDIASDEGRWEEAQTRYTRALEVRELTLGPDHPVAATTWFRLGMALAHRGRIDEARDALARADQIGDARYGTEHVAADLLHGTAELLALLGDREEALRRYQRALDAFQSKPRSSPLATGDIRFAMAKLLARNPDASHETRTLLEAARTDYRRAGPRGRTALTRLESWQTETKLP